MALQYSKVPAFEGIGIAKHAGADSIDDLLPELVTLRHDLHVQPELAFEERRTAGIVAASLRLLGLEVHEGLAGTGVVGTLRHGSSDRTVGLRADMDALPIAEQSRPDMMNMAVLRPWPH